ncbi:MAG: sigma-70 family RNA polymerase sigma factor, partial [Nocardioides sp.]
LGVATDRVVEALAAIGCFTPASLDAAGSDEEGAVARLGGEEPGYARVEARITLRRLVRGLSSRERHILELRFVRGCTQAEIGTEIGVTQTQVSRQLTHLLERLRLRAGAA